MEKQKNPLYSWTYYVSLSIFVQCAFREYALTSDLPVVSDSDADRPEFFKYFIFSSIFIINTLVTKNRYCKFFFERRIRIKIFSSSACRIQYKSISIRMMMGPCTVCPWSLFYICQGQKIRLRILGLWVLVIYFYCYIYILLVIVSQKYIYRTFIFLYFL